MNKLTKSYKTKNNKTECRLLYSPIISILNEFNPNDKKFAALLQETNRIYKKELPHGYSNIDCLSFSECLNDDTYSEEVGKTIAGAKVDYKYHKRIINKCNGYIKLFTTIINKLEEIKRHHQKQEKDALKRIHKYD